MGGDGGANLMGRFKSGIGEMGHTQRTFSTSFAVASLFECFKMGEIGEGNGNPLQCSCLDNPRDGETWWAAVYGVAQSQT